MANAQITSEGGLVFPAARDGARLAIPSAGLRSAEAGGSGLAIV